MGVIRGSVLLLSWGPFFSASQYMLRNLMIRKDPTEFPDAVLAEEDGTRAGGS